MTPVSIECESRIERVVVYARGAVVARRIALPNDLPDGPIEIAVRGITALAEPGSARVLTEGEREVIGLQTKRDVPKTPSPGAVAKRLRQLKLERIELTREQGRLRSRRERLASVTLDPGMAKPWRRIDPHARIADALALSGLLNHELERADARLAALEEALEKNERERVHAEIEALQAKTSQLKGDRPPSLELLVRLGPGGAVQSLEIEYVVAPARWVPTYAARFSAGAARVEWTIEALVAQASGEDWSHVRLALSTADLVRDARLPELASLRLGKAQPPAQKGYRAPPEGLDAMFEGLDRFLATLPPANNEAFEEGRASLLPPEPKQEPAGATTTIDALMTVRTPRSASDDAMMAFEAAEAGELAVEEKVTRLTLPSADTLAQQQYNAPSRAPSRAELRTVAAVAPPAPRMAAPAPQRAPAPTTTADTGDQFARSKGIGLFSSRGAPELSRAAPEGSASFGGGGALGSAAGWERPEPEAIEPADAWLNFDALVLPDASSSLGSSRGSRGRLAREPSPSMGDDARRGGAIDSVELIEIPEQACDPRDGRGHFDHRYDAESLADVPSDARLHRVSVLSASAPSTARFVTIPRESAEVYREAEIQNPFDAPLLAGPVEVFIDGALLTQSSVGHVDRGGSVLLGLGVEDRLRVARNARVDESTAGLLGGSTAVEHAVAIELASALGREVEVTVIDRIPIADDKDIDVKTLYVRPAAEAYAQTERGSPIRKGLRWLVTVPPGGKAKIELGYKVVLPSKSEIVGGNRRE